MTTVEPQYRTMIERREMNGVEKLGLSTSYAWNDDPKRLAFTLARYKFVAKMLTGKRSALEVGCGDAFGTRIVLQEVGNLVAVDMDPEFVEDARSRMSPDWHFSVAVHDILDGPVTISQRSISKKFEAAYALDVIEHVDQKDEKTFVSHVAASIEDNGVAIFGSPSLASQHLASKLSREGHVNCKDGPDLQLLLKQYFHNVFMFSMSDEVVHTGHHKMAHYLLAVCAGVKPWTPN